MSDLIIKIKAPRENPLKKVGGIHFYNYERMMRVETHKDWVYYWNSFNTFISGKKTYTLAKLKELQADDSNTKAYVELPTSEDDPNTMVTVLRLVGYVQLSNSALDGCKVMIVTNTELYLMGSDGVTVDKLL